MSLGSALLSLSAPLPRAKLQRRSILNHSKHAFHLGGVSRSLAKALASPSSCWPLREAVSADGSAFCSKNSATQGGTSGNPQQEYLVLLQHAFLHPLAQGELAAWDLAPFQILALSDRKSVV